VFWVISVYFNIRNTLPKSGTFLLGHPIYLGGILPLKLYGTPVWKSVLKRHCYKAKLIRIQRLINLKMAKAYRTVSNEALCIINGITPINIKIE